MTKKEITNEKLDKCIKHLTIELSNLHGIVGKINKKQDEKIDKLNNDILRIIDLLEKLLKMLNYEGKI